MRSFMFAALAVMASATAHAKVVECNSRPGPGDYRFQFVADLATRTLHENHINKETGAVITLVWKVDQLTLNAKSLDLRTRPEAEPNSGIRQYLQIVAQSENGGRSGMVKWYQYRSDDLGLNWDWYWEGLTYVDCVVK